MKHNLVTDPTTAPDNKGSKLASKNASGPKTLAGKRRVRLNALRHGFYSQELVVGDEDRAGFEVLKKGIQTNLDPTTQLQQLGFERVVSAAWRLKLALRMEARRLKPQLDANEGQDSGEATIGTPCWYTSGRQGLNIAAKGLTELREEVRVSGGLHLENYMDWIVSTFGSDFYGSLAEWGPTNKDAILMAEMLVQHAASFKQPLPEMGVSLNSRPVDERARWNMMVKVVDLKLQEINEVYRLLGQTPGEAESPQTVALDVVNRYVTSTARELERAVDWYRQLLDMGL